jgi:peptidoglycan hydrolase CwlO-like protein
MSDRDETAREMARLVWEAYGPKIETIESDTSHLKNVQGQHGIALANLQDQVNRVQGDVSGLKEDVSGLKEDVSGLKEDVSGLKEDVSGLKGDVSGLKEDVSGLKGDVARQGQMLEALVNHFDQ